MSNDNVISLNGQRVPPPGEPNPVLVTMLEKLLEGAKQGKYQSLVGTGFTSDGLRYAVWCDTQQDVYGMMGALSWLGHEYVQRVNEAIDKG